MSTVIKVENLSKQYRLGDVGTGSMAHDVNRAWHKLRGKEDPYLKIGESNDRTKKGNSEYVWALKDINFEVKQGEVLGIIGRNGAGKSTLLKILSRTTTPTTGSVKIRGRVASLLEVGTGFHPELSGRENIFLNGAIMGMTKHEIKRKFDEIVDFAGVERYIDTPVKRYSSGMYVRLAFGVAAHLEPEILIVDEVLAVGDAEFQKKALGKMQDVSEKEGRTVLFVSHNMGAMATICQTGIYMQNGSIAAQGQIDAIVENYLLFGQKNVGVSNFKNTYDNKQKDAIVESIRLIDIKGNNIDLLGTSDEIIVEVTIDVFKWEKGYEFALSLQDKYSKRIFTISKKLDEFISESEKTKTIQFKFPSNFVTPSKYAWLASIHIPLIKIIDEHSGICSFKIIDTGTPFAIYGNADYGYIFMNNYNFKIL